MKNEFEMFETQKLWEQKKKNLNFKKKSLELQNNVKSFKNNYEDGWVPS